MLGTNAWGYDQSFGCDLNVTIQKPDHSTLTSGCLDVGGFIDVQTLPTAGTYTIVPDPLGAVSGGVTLTPYDVPADPTGTITPAGTAAPRTTTTPVQNTT